jgi:hypothetical protein
MLHELYRSAMKVKNSAVQFYRTEISLTYLFYNSEQYTLNPIKIHLFGPTVEFFTLLLNIFLMIISLKKYLSSINI